MAVRLPRGYRRGRDGNGLFYWNGPTPITEKNPGGSWLVVATHADGTFSYVGVGGERNGEGNAERAFTPPPLPRARAQPRAATARPRSPQPPPRPLPPPRPRVVARPRQPAAAPPPATPGVMSRLARFLRRIADTLRGGGR